jgi:hypothetical protein
VLQVEDLSRSSLRAAKENWAEMGMAKQRIGGAIEEAGRAKASAKERHGSPEGEEDETPGDYEKKMGHRESTLKAVEPHVEDKPITMRGAISQRLKLAEAGRQRARQEGGIGEADWFFTHHNLIRGAARETGTATGTAIRSTTGMSPMNPPETERAAGHGMMRLVNEPHTVEMTPELHKATKAKVKKLGGPPIPEEQIGQTVKTKDLHHTHLAAIGSVDASMRKKGTPIQSTAPEAFTALGATRQSAAAAKGMQHLRGQTPPGQQVIHPWTSPKVKSYEESTQEAEPGSAEHGELGVRLHHWIHGDPNQGVLDLWGKRHSEEGMLSSGRKPGPGSHTPEDTWMQSVSTGQTPKNIGGGGRGVSVAKTVGSESRLAGAEAMTKTTPSGGKIDVDPLIGGYAVTHALNNFATRQASQRVPIRMGAEYPKGKEPKVETYRGEGGEERKRLVGGEAQLVTTNMPVRALHPIVWSEMRRQADKDPEYRKAQESTARRAEVGGRQFEAEQLTTHRKVERRKAGVPAPTQTQMPGEVQRGQRGQVRTRRGEVVRGPARTVPLPKRATQPAMFAESGEPTAAARIPKRNQRGA